MCPFTLIIALALAVLLQQKLKEAKFSKQSFLSAADFQCGFRYYFYGAVSRRRSGKRCIGMAWRGGSASVAHLHGMVYDDDDCDRIGNKNFGYYMVLFIAGLQGIPEDLYEAASLDGANMWKNSNTSRCPCFLLQRSCVQSCV